MFITEWNSTSPCCFSHTCVTLRYICYQECVVTQKMRSSDNFSSVQNYCIMAYLPTALWHICQAITQYGSTMYIGIAMGGPAL